MTKFVTISQDILNSDANAVAFDYAQDHEKVTVKQNVTVASNFDAIYSNKPNSVLINNGNLIGDGRAVEFDTLADNSMVTNALGALIVGSDQGVRMEGHGSQTFNNFGTDIATISDSIFFGTNVQMALVNNHGKLLSAFHAVHTEAAGVVNNFGIMKGTAAAIHLDIFAAPNSIVTINNRAGGLLKGGAAIDSDNGIFHFNNFGKIIGDILDNAAANDVVRNGGIIQGQVKLGGGDDFFRDIGSGRSGPVFGDSGADHLIEGIHNDLLHGGDGVDKLTGGRGADKFFFDTLLDAVTNVDTITDFTPAQHDKIVVSADKFSGLLPGALDNAHFHVGAPVNGNPQIDYSPSTGALVFDSDGNGAMAPTQFATLLNLAHVHAGDFIVIA